METQPTQQGLMQLFMSLGLSTADSLTTLGEGAKPEGSGFDSLLAGYLPDAEVAAGPIALDADTNSLLESELSSGVAVLGLAAEATVDEVEGLPLLTQEIGELLPLSERPMVNTNSAKTPIIPSTEIRTGADETSQALLEDQGFYAQSLVSSTLPTNMTSSNTANQAGVTEQAKMNAMVEQHSAAHALASLQARGASSNKSLTDAVGQPVIADADDLSMDDESALDRFLGATQKDSDARPRSTLSSVSPGSATTSSLATAAQVPTQLMATAESNVSLALSMGEDPIMQSLQDLTAVEDAEKTEVDAKLMSTERKQDDQTLKLTKGQQAWGDALSERISLNAAKNIKQVTIHLDPPELGTLELKLQIKDDQQTQVQVQVQNPQVKEALESSAHRLRDMLASEGLELSEFDVQTGSEQSAGGESHDSEQGLEEDQQNSDTLMVEGDEALDINLPKNNNLLDTFV